MLMCLEDIATRQVQGFLSSQRVERLVTTTEHLATATKDQLEARYSRASRA